MEKLAFILLLLFSSNLLAEAVKPFWTEKSSYIEGDNLYAVGIATKSSSVEKGRKLAFKNGKREIMNFSQLSNINGLPIKTQMTYTEQIDSKHTVYRLLFVNYEKLNSLISKNSSKANKNYRRLQEKQEEEIKIKTAALRKIKKNNAELARLDIRFNEIAQGIETLSEKAFRYVKAGMTSYEVESLIGKPRTSHYDFNKGGQKAYNYGKYWVLYGGAGDTVKCLSTTYKCILQKSYNCNKDLTVCKDDDVVTYYHRMIK